MNAQRRLDALSSQINTSATTTQSPGLQKILEKNPDDIVCFRVSVFPSFSSSLELPSSTRKTNVSDKSPRS